MSSRPHSAESHLLMTATYRLQLTPDVGFAEANVGGELEAVGGSHQKVRLSRMGP